MRAEFLAGMNVTVHFRNLKSSMALRSIYKIVLLYLLHLDGWSIWKSFFGVAKAINLSDAFAVIAPLEMGHIIS